MQVQAFDRFGLVVIPPVGTSEGISMPSSAPSKLVFERRTHFVVGTICYAQRLLQAGNRKAITMTMVWIGIGALALSAAAFWLMPEPF